jgi:hypothetical protein
MRYTLHQLRGLRFEYLYKLSNKYEDFIQQLWNEGLDDTDEYQNALNYKNMIDDVLNELYY